MVTNNKTWIKDDILAESLKGVDFELGQQRPQEEDEGKVQSLDVAPPHGNMILWEESSISPTSTKEVSLLEYCKKDRSKELETWSKSLTR